MRDPNGQQIAEVQGSAWLRTLAAHARARPDHFAIVEVAPDGCLDRSVTYAQFAEQVHARAGTLCARFEPGATLMLALRSGVEAATWMAASLAAGVRLVLMHSRCVIGECRAVAIKARAAALLSASDAELWADGPCPRVDPRTWVDHNGSDAHAPKGVASPGAFVLGSSGTTGLPKLVERRSPALDAVAVAIAHGLGLQSDDVVLCVAPMSHSYGVDLLLGTLYAGATLRVMPELDAQGVARQLESDVSVLPSVPFVYESLARMSGRKASRLRLAVSAGSALAARVRHAFEAAWSVPIGQLYGATELGTTMIERPEAPGFDPVSVGRPLPGVSARLVSTDGTEQDVRVGDEGQLAVRAPSMMTRYLDEHCDLIDGHFLTGDLARVDDSGRVRITGRLKLQIDVGGYKVNPMEVEAALMEHPGVAECAVGALEMSDTIRRVRAWFVAADSDHAPDDRELRSFLKNRLSSNKIPRVFERVDGLPRTPTGKLIRTGLPGATA